MRCWALAALLLTLAACRGGPFPEGVEPPGPGGGSGPAVPLLESSAGRALVAGQVRFAAALYKEVSAPPGSVVVSPCGVFTTLGMLREGARGTTATALDRALGLEGEAPEGWSWLHQGLASAKMLRSASAVWLERSVPPSEAFLRALDERHRARRETFDAGKPAATAADVNAWASRHTDGRIPEILAPSDLSSYLRLILTNAVYFRDRWKTEFPRGATRDEPFHAAPDRTLEVPMMHLRSSFSLREHGAARVLAMPHRGGATELLLVLPAEGHTLAEVESDLAGGALATWTGPSYGQEVDLSLPRFRVESKHDLKAPMTALGVGVAFGPGADLTGVGIVDPLGPLFVDDLRQRALLECDEQGTTAAAVTAASLSCSAPAQPVAFRCDRPFLFVLRHLPTGAILFVGRYAG